MLVLVEAHQWWEHYNEITKPDPSPTLEMLEKDLQAALEELDRLMLQLSAAPWTLTRWRGWRAPSRWRGWRPPSADRSGISGE